MLISSEGVISVLTPKVTDAPFNTLPVCWSNNLPVMVYVSSLGIWDFSFCFNCIISSLAFFTIFFLSSLSWFDLALILSLADKVLSTFLVWTKASVFSSSVEVNKVSKSIL
jgi:hypothetical protein